MSFVGISRGLLEGVKAQIDGMEAAEAKQLSEVLPTLSGSESYAQEAIWGDHMEFRSKLPKEWGTEVVDYAIKFKVDDTDKHYDTSGSFKKKQFAPRKKGAGSYYNDAYCVNIKFDAGKCPPELQPVLDYLLACKERTARWVKVKSDVNKFLQSCKSVNEAIKLWPDIVMYLPHDVVEKVAEKKTVEKSKSTAADMLSAINTDELTSAAVIARLSGFKK